MHKCNGTRILIFAALSGLASVALGAFAAHGLTKLISLDLVEVFKTGVQYQMWHTLALLACSILIAKEVDQIVHKRLVIGSICFIIGIFCFSGSLYALALTGVKFFGPITPLGGVFFLVGWFNLFLAALKMSKS